MCGITGIIGKGVKLSTINRMLYSQSHRGPDNTGVWEGENAILGHNRLSIIDLSKESNQPFLDNYKRYVLSFNGEIYNYVELKEQLKHKYIFKTNSDTEVLLAGYIVWGKDCLSKFNGMFSFVIYDTINKTLFAARDRFGVKPFYYHLNNGTLFFSSEIKAIHSAGIEKTQNEQVWANYLVYGSYGMPEESFWEGINQLPGGHYLEFKNNSISISKWYDFEMEIKKYSREPLHKVKEQYLSLLKDSINLRFRSDVKVGFNISGGLDSSTLLTLVNLYKSNETINAYTFYTNNKKYDELPWVEEMISLTKNSLKKVLLSVDDISDKIEELSYFQDEPFGGIPTIAYSQIFKKARNENILVLLDGQGMDEQWAGYDYYINNNSNNIQGTIKSPFRTNVLSDKLLKRAKKPIYPTPFNDDLLNKQYRDLFYTKIPRALRFNDRISMANSTELREPFLDYRLVEYAFAQPIEYKIKNGIQKYLLREIVADYLSDSITLAPKRPLQTPQREWLGIELKDYVSKQIEMIETSQFSEWFKLNELRLEWEKYKRGENESSFHIWQWVSISNFLIRS